MIKQIWVIMIGLFLWSSLFAGNVVAEEKFNARLAMRETVANIEKYHLSKKPLDDTISRKWLKRFIEQLDPRKMYFLQADIQEFQKFENQLDDQAKNNDFTFPEQVRKRFRERVKAATTAALEFIEVEHDFSADEKVTREFATYTKKPDELRERWRLRIKAELLIEKLHGRERSEVQAQLRGRYGRIEKQAREMTDERLCDIYLNALTKSYDPHSEFMSPELLMMFRQTYTIRRYSLGLGLRQHRGQFKITSFPNQKWDTKSKFVGWNLLALRRLNGKIIDVVEMPLNELAWMISRPDKMFTESNQGADIILELMHPDTYERQSVSWKLFQTFPFE